MKHLRFILILPLLLASCTMNGHEIAIPTVTPTPPPTLTATWLVGDLGWGSLTGIVRDGLTNAPIQGAIVTCEHFSYTSPAPCNGSTTTAANGTFKFEKVFFHDTDRITVRITASGHYPQFYEKDFFDQPEFSLNAYMLPVDYTPVIMCTPPACPRGQGEFTCGDPNGCPGGCGTICATLTPTP